jgi:hypothetical protein
MPAWTATGGALPTKHHATPLDRKREAVKALNALEGIERATRPRGHQNGAATRSGIEVFRALIFRFRHGRTGALWPSHAALAYATGRSVASVKRGLVALRELGVITWAQRRVGEVGADGMFRLRQLTNSYEILPTWCWKRAPPAPPPAPEAGTWGDHPFVAPFDAAARGDLLARIAGLEVEAGEAGGLSAALARFGRAVLQNGAGGKVTESSG